MNKHDRPGRLESSYIDGAFKLLRDYIEAVFLAKAAPEDSHIFDGHVEWDGRQGSQEAEEEAYRSQPIQAKGLDDAKDVHVQIHGPHEGTQKVEQ